MLLSQAMAEGLFHPRCRHGLGTYYPELEDIVHYETEDNKLNEYGTEELNRAHVENMIQKYKRLIVGSLDPANIAKYQARLNEWEHRKTQLGIANSENSGIINYKEVYRKKSEQSNYGISQKRFDELTIEAKKNGATILRGTDEIEKHLDSVNAQAATLGDTMLFRKNVRVCDVLEESYHFMQNKKGINIDKTEPLRTYLNEIEAKQFIIDNERKYKVPRIEIEETKRQLSEYQKSLKKWRDDNDL